MNDVARLSRPKPAGASRKRDRRRRTGIPSRKPNEKSPAGREDRTTERVFMNSPGEGAQGLLECSSSWNQMSSFGST